LKRVVVDMGAAAAARHCAGPRHGFHGGARARPPGGPPPRGRAPGRGRQPGGARVCASHRGGGAPDQDGNDRFLPNGNFGAVVQHRC
jgi:hypothetical protein